MEGLVRSTELKRACNTATRRGTP